MKTALMLLGVALLVSGTPAHGPAEDVPQWKDLFNGKDLTGWINVNCAKDTWGVRDGMIVCTGKPNGCMVTKKEYGDYVLKLKWRWPAEGKGGNSGVLLHVQDEKYWPTSIEAQFLRPDIKQSCVARVSAILSASQMPATTSRIVTKSPRALTVMR